MTKAAAAAFKRRWRIANAMERAELRNASPELKLRHFAALIVSIAEFGWRPTLDAGVAEVRERWQRLRKFYGV